MPTNAVPTSDEIWKILIETNASLDRTNASLDRTNATLDKTAASQKETDKLLKESSRKARQEIKELRLSQKETDKQIKKTEALFNTQWGRLMESLVEGDLLKILQEKGVNVDQTYRNVEHRGHGDDYEYDIVAANGHEVVVVEVKTTLKVRDVKDFLVSVGKFTTRRPQYRDNTVYGAVAWLRADDGAVAYAEKHGLFVIRATGSSASIINQDDFKPQVFS